MLKYLSLKLVILLLFNIYHILCDNLALSHVTLLLPYTSDKSNKISYTIHANGGSNDGCVQWFVNHREYVKITGLNGNNCPDNTFKDLLVTAVSLPKYGRVSATITAQDIITKQTAQCQVFVDEVDQLQIATSTRLIYLTKYESITVTGLDSKQNTFTTLNGLPMKWNDKLWTKLSKLSFENAKLYLPKQYNNIVNINNEPTNMQPVRGDAIGRQRIEVNLDKNKLDGTHQNCKKADAVFFVVMKLEIEPGILYMIPCSNAKLHLMVNKDDGKIMELIDIDTYKYKFSITGSRYITIDPDGTVKAAKNSFGEEASVSVVDHITETSQMKNSAESKVQVVEAVLMKAEIMKKNYDDIVPLKYYKRKDVNVWHLTEKDVYIVKLSLLDKNDKTICVTEVENYRWTQYINEKNPYRKQILKESLVWKQQFICKGITFGFRLLKNLKTKTIIKSDERSKYLSVKGNSKTGTNQEMLLQPKKAGDKFEIRFYALGCGNREVASVKKDIWVQTPVKWSKIPATFCPYSIQDKLGVLMPYVGDGEGSSVSLEYTGGSHKYRLQVLNDNIAYFEGYNDNDGTQATKSKLITKGKIDSTYLFVIDYFNPDNYDYIPLKVEEINSIKLLNDNTNKEIKIGNNVRIPLQIRASNDHYFSSLNNVQKYIHFQYQYRHISASFVSRTDKDKDIHKCALNDAIIVVNGVKIGFDSLILITNNKLRTDPSWFSVYDRLYTNYTKFVVAININDHYIIKWKGGPNAWPINFNDLSRTNQLRIEMKSKAGDVNNNDFNYQHLYKKGNQIRFVCLKEFHKTILLTVTNKVTNTLKHPVKESLSLEVWCVEKIKFNPNIIDDLSVGGAKRLDQYYPKWLNTPMGKGFFIHIHYSKNDMINVNGNTLIGKRLGYCKIMGDLRHNDINVYIHEPGLVNATLEVVITFTGFVIKVPSNFIIQGNNIVAHIEGKDNILPLKHNFDDITITWISEDANIIELYPVLSLPNNDVIFNKRNNKGKGLSVKLKTNSLGAVKLKANVVLNNAPKRIKKSNFKLDTTIVVIPNVIKCNCNQYILPPKSEMIMSNEYPDGLTIDNYGILYQRRVDSTDQHVIVKGNIIEVTPTAPQKDVFINILYRPVNKNNHENEIHLSQSSSIVVAVVNPTGINIKSNKPYNLNQYRTKYEFHETENIMCVGQEIELKLPLLDELARSLNSISNYFKFESNDTDVVNIVGEITKTTQDSIMYGILRIKALSVGYATIMMREDKDEYDTENQFLRTFIAINVLSTDTCQTIFGNEYLTMKPQNDSTQSCIPINNVNRNNKYTNNYNINRWKRTNVSLKPNENWKKLFGTVLVILVPILLCLYVGSGYSIFNFDNNNANNISGSAFNPTQNNSQMFDSPFYQRQRIQRIPQ